MSTIEIGDGVQTDEVIAEVETDKVNVNKKEKN